MRLRQLLIAYGEAHRQIATEAIWITGRYGKTPLPHGVERMSIECGIAAG
jgi:hypothetical protein